MAAKKKVYANKTLRRLKVFGPFLLAVSIGVLVVGAFLQWKLFHLSKNPLSIAQVGEEKRLVTLLKENARDLLSTREISKVRNKTKEIHMNLAELSSIHNSLIKWSEGPAVPREIKEPLVDRVFPYFDDVVTATQKIPTAYALRNKRFSLTNITSAVEEVANKSELYLFFLDHLDLKLARSTQLEIGRLRWVEGFVIVSLGLLLLVTTVWLFFPVSNMISHLIFQMDRILRKLRKKNRSLKKLQILVKERLQLALSVSRTGTFVWCKDTNYLALDANLASLFGLRDPSQVKTVEELVERVDPSFQDKAKSHFKRIFENGQDIALLKVLVDGKAHWLRDHSMVVKSGTNLKVVGACTDQTELMHEINSSREARIQAEKANRSKTEFIANMSHDMRTPLSAILGFTEILIKEGEMPSEKRSKVLNLIRRNGNSLLNFIEDLLDVTRIETGHETVSLKSFSLKRLLDEVCDAFRLPCQKKKLQLVLRYHEEVTDNLISDPLLFERIITNLVSNAVRYSSHGRILMDVFQSSSSKEGPFNLSIFVSDQGKGIAPEKQAKIFEPFSEREKVVDMNRSTGLGLYVGKKLAKILGGDLVLESSVLGEGTTFKFTVPVQKGKQQPEKEAKDGWKTSSSSSDELEGLRVLVVEDDINLQELMRAILLHFGISCDVASTGEEAIDLLSKNSFDLVTMDIRLPGMDGVEVTTRMRQFGFKGYIVAISAHAFPSEKKRALEAGCNHYLTKPIQISELAKVLEEVTQQKKVKDQTKAS